MEELSAMMWVNQFRREQRYDVIVLDCAPTAESMRFVSMPTTLDWYMKHIFPFQRTILKAVRPLANRVSPVELPTDSYFANIQDLFGKLDGIDDLLENPRITSVRLVTNPEGNAKGPGHPLAADRRTRGAHVAAHRDRHADEARQPRERRAGEEAHRAPDAVLGEGHRDRVVGAHDFGGSKEDEDCEGHEDDEDRAELALEERLGALLDGLGDLAHLDGAGVRGEDASDQVEAGGDADHPAGDHAPEDQAVVAGQREVLVAALGGETVKPVHLGGGLSASVPGG